MKIQNNLPGSRIKGVLALMAACAILLAGCSPLKPTAASLTGKMITNVQKVQSAEVNMEVESDVRVQVASLGVGMDVTIGTSSDMEITKEPARTREKHAFSFSGFGQTVDMKSEQYTEKTEDGTTITYQREEGGEWKKSIVKKEKEDGEEGSSDTQSSGPVSPLHILGFLKEAGDTLKDAELKEELATINGEEAYQIDFTLSGDMIRKLLSESGKDVEELGIDLDAVDWSQVLVPGQLYIYKKTTLPARVRLDLKSLGGDFLGQIFQKQLDGSMLEGLQLDFQTFTVDAVFDKYDEIEEIVIPQEALEAEETEEKESDLSNLDLSGLF